MEDLIEFPPLLTFILHRDPIQFDCIDKPYACFYNDNDDNNKNGIS